jgi:hypothetical protein
MELDQGSIWERRETVHIVKTQTVHRKTVLAFVAITLVLAVMLGVVVSADDTEPTWRPPTISKLATKPSLLLGDTVKFLITVKNPADPDPPAYPEIVTWYGVAASDAVADAFDVSAYNIPAWEGPKPTVSISGNTVTATASSMDPGDWFVLEITCELVGPVDSGIYLTNQASVVYYEDEAGGVGITYNSDEVSIFVGYRVALPLVLRNSTP